jgi:hypothetical protein
MCEDTQGLLDQLTTIREMVRERNTLLQDLANLVVQAASVGLNHVDSQVILDLLSQHQDKVNKIMEKVKV